MQPIYPFNFSMFPSVLLRLWLDFLLWCLANVLSIRECFCSLCANFMISIKIVILFLWLISLLTHVCLSLGTELLAFKWLYVTFVSCTRPKISISYNATNYLLSEVSFSKIWRMNYNFKFISWLAWTYEQRYYKNI